MTLGEFTKWYDSAVTLVVSGNWESLSIAQAIALFLGCCCNAILLVVIIRFIWNVVVFFREFWEEIVADFPYLFIFVVMIVIFFILYILIVYV
jgi:hypothetical protein